MRKFILPALLWICFWVVLASRHVPPTVPTRAEVVWPPSEVFRDCLNLAPNSMCESLGPVSSDPHGPWSVEELERRPDALAHLRVCNMVKHNAPLPALAQNPQIELQEHRFHPLDGLSSPGEVERIRGLFERLQELKSPLAVEVEHWLARHCAEFRPVLLKHLDDPSNREWLRDLEALVQNPDAQSRAVVERLAQHSHPEVRRKASIAGWVLDPSDLRLREQVLSLSSTSIWARRALLTHGPLPLRRQYLLHMLDSSERIHLGGLILEPSLQEEAEEVLRKTPFVSPSRRSVNALSLLSWQPLDSRKRELFRPFLSRADWLTDWRIGDLLPVLWADPEARQWPEWEALWKTRPALLSELEMTEAEERKYLSALRELDRLKKHDAWTARAFCRQGLITPERAISLWLGPDEGEVNMTWKESRMLGDPLAEAVTPEMVKAILVQVARWIAQGDPRGPKIWKIMAASPRLQPWLMEFAVQRLAQEQFDGTTLKVLCSNGIQEFASEIRAIRQGSGASAGIAAALLGEQVLDHPSPVFLAYHLLAHLTLKNQELPLLQVYQIQEGAPSPLFQAAQAYLEANPKEQAQELVKRRGGRLIHVRKFGDLDRTLVNRLSLELLDSDGPGAIYAWQLERTHVIVRIFPGKATLSKLEFFSVERLRRDLSLVEIGYLQSLQQPAPPRYRDLSGERGFLVKLTPEGSWSFDLSQTSIESEATRLGIVEKLNEIALGP